MASANHNANSLADTSNTTSSHGAQTLDLLSQEPMPRRGRWLWKKGPPRQTQVDAPMTSQPLENTTSMKKDSALRGRYVPTPGPRSRLTPGSALLAASLRQNSIGQEARQSLGAPLPTMSWRPAPRAHQTSPEPRFTTDYSKRKKQYSEKYLPVPKNTFRNPDSEKARQKRENKILSKEQLTMARHRAANGHAGAAQALRAHVAAIKASNDSSLDPENENKSEGGNISGAKYRSMRGPTVRLAMPTRVVRKPIPEIVVTGPEDAVRGDEGNDESGYLECLI